MTENTHRPIEDAPLFCKQCRCVTTHYRTDLPHGDEDAWICDECAWIEALVACAAAEAQQYP
jgi:RNase P subunit RPR2